MAEYSLKSRSIPMIDSYDVAVIGGGPAGVTAAVAAAREGAKTLLVEATGCLGGMGTSGLIPAWCPFSDKQKIIYRGLAERVFNEARKGVPHVPTEKVDWVPINPEQLKRVYDDMVVESGAAVLFNTFMSAVETDGAGNVEAVIVSNKAGLSAIRAKVYVDCTGDADLAAWAGCEFAKGAEGSGELQPATHCFILSNVDEYGHQHMMTSGGKKWGEGLLQKAIASGKYPQIKDVHFCRNFIGPSTMGFNSGHLWNVDNTDPTSLSKALIDGRKLALALRDALAEYWPAAFANAYLANTASLMGCRETRRIVGDYVLTIDDYLARRSFDDEICRNNYWIDIHTAAGEISAARKNTEHVVKRFEHYGPGESHGLPYRCLLPVGLRNVLVAGRSISCDRLVQGSVRVMPVCLCMGEAAGLAAAMSLGATGDARSVDTAQLRRRLVSYGAYLP